MKIFTIGFTKSSAAFFFERLLEAEVARVVDARLNNTSQIAGFTKMKDLQYFLRVICDIDYIHLPELAPTKEILEAYKKGGGEWEIYERLFMALMSERKIEETLNKDLLDRPCLLCSEVTPDHCHRRLVVEYLSDKWGDVEICHL